MLSPFTRLGVAVPVTALVIAWIMHAESGFSDVVIKPAFAIDQIPTTVGDWAGQIEEIDEDVFRVLNADQEVCVRFDHAGDSPVFVHCAVWSSDRVITKSCPHHPSSCYRSQGWTLTETKQIDIDVNGTPAPVQLSLFTRGVETVVVAHCYRMGDHRFTTFGDGEKVIRGLWGAKEWPAVVKYMVQIPASSLDAAAPIAKEFASTHLVWSSI